MTAEKKPDKPRKAPARKSNSKGKDWPPHIRLMLVGLLVLLGLVLILAVPTLYRSIQERPPQVGQREKPVRIDHQPPRRADLQALLSELFGGSDPKELVPLSGGGLPGWRIMTPYPVSDRSGALRKRLLELDSGLALKEDPTHSVATVLWNGQPYARLQFQASPAEVVPTAAPRLAIVVDDLGQDLAIARALVKIDLPVTFAILPNTPAATAVDDLAHRNGREVILHLPMEPANFPVANPGSDALWLSTGAEEVQELLAEYFRKVPHAVGGNNHMGSRFTADRTAMERVLLDLRRRGVFFLDSVTTAESVAYEEAARLGVRRARRDVFLDNDVDVEPIRNQLRKLADLAVRRGTAIGICHPHPATLEALRREEGELKRRGIVVVPVSKLLEG